MVPPLNGGKLKNLGQQSPINIITSEAIEAPLPDLRLITFSDPKNSSTIFENNGEGHTIKMSTDIVYTLSGGPLTEDFQFDELHCHWRHDGSGSEHKIDGRAYDMEMHFVFFKKSLKTFKAAINNSHGLAAIAVFYNYDDDQYSELDEKMIWTIQAAASFRGNFVYDKYFDLSHLIPLSSDYFTYDGSLTTPPYSENVRWIVFRNPIRIEQMEFPFETSHRPIQSTGDRPVYLVKSVHKNNVLKKTK